MKVKCIDNYGWLSLTICKIYEVINIDYFGDYIIIDDDNDKWIYPKKCFKSLSDYRNEKIDKLLK